MKHEQRTMVSFGITEKAVEIKPGKELAEYKSFAPLYGKCDECETGWASESNLKLHKNVNHVKVTRVQSFEVDTKNHTDWDVDEKILDSNKLEQTAARLCGYHEAE